MAAFISQDNQSYSQSGLPGGGYPYQQGSGFGQKLVGFKGKHIERVDQLSVDSADRDRDIYPASSYFEVHVGTVADTFDGAHITEPFKDIKSIELVSAVIPDVNSIGSEPYMLVDIEEFHDQNAYFATNKATTQAIAKLYFNVPSNGGFYRYKTMDSNERHIINFYPPLASFHKMRIRLLDRDGAVFDLGTDTTPPTPVNKALQVSYTFRVTCLVPDNSSFGQYAR